MATEAQMDDLIHAIGRIELETEGSAFDKDDVQFITHNLYRIAESLEILTKHLIDNK